MALRQSKLLVVITKSVLFPKAMPPIIGREQERTSAFENTFSCIFSLTKSLPPPPIFMN
jgi:hypothetical protein